MLETTECVLQEMFPQTVLAQTLCASGCTWHCPSINNLCLVPLQFKNIYSIAFTVPKHLLLDVSLFGRQKKAENLIIIFTQSSSLMFMSELSFQHQKHLIKFKLQRSCSMKSHQHSYQQYWQWLYTFVKPCFMATQLDTNHQIYALNGGRTRT